MIGKRTNVQDCAVVHCDSGVANIIATFSLGKVLTNAGPSGYFYAFMIAGSAYLVLLGVAHLLMPHMTPLDENLQHVKR